MTIIDNKLRRIDFTNGVRSADIDQNFTTLNTGMQRERLRAAGMGIVEGFEMTKTSQFGFVIGEGVLVNDKGEEIFIAQTNMAIDPPLAIDYTETLMADNQGELELKFRPYSPTKKGCITDAWYQSHYPIDAELTIVDINNLATKIKAVQVNGKTITLSAISWAGKAVRVSYKYTSNRMDSVMLERLTGQYSLEKGITSPSPSMIDIVDYPLSLAIGTAEIIVGDDAVMTIEQGYRSFRKVFVNEHNILYLNGKPYREQPFVHFSEPSQPYENALWYDHATNYLYIWKQTDGDWGWVIVNDASVMPFRCDMVFSPELNPGDLQTFMIPENRTDMKFMPNTSALEIIIDNSPLMMDQFTEIVETGEKPYLSTGIGFKLKDPLDRATFVQLRVLHCVRTAPLKETFQRAAVFVNENFQFHQATDVAQIYNANDTYVIGEKQLTVFVDGIRLEPGAEVVEIDGADVHATMADRGKMSSRFKVIKPLTPGQRVSHRIERWVWSFEHLDQMVHEIETTADAAKLTADNARIEITTLSNEVVDRFNDVEEDIGTLTAQFGALDGYLKDSDELPVTNLAAEVRTGLVSAPVYMTKTASAINTLVGLKKTDYVVVFYQTETSAKPLIPGAEYTLSGEGEDCTMTLSNDLVSSEASLFITGIRLGR
jgi:hypothetical protein